MKMKIAATMLAIAAGAVGSPSSATEYLLTVTGKVGGYIGQTNAPAPNSGLFGQPVGTDVSMTTLIDTDSYSLDESGERSNFYTGILGNSEIRLGSTAINNPSPMNISNIIFGQGIFDFSFGFQSSFRPNGSDPFTVKFELRDLGLIDPIYVRPKPESLALGDLPPFEAFGRKKATLIFMDERGNSYIGFYDFADLKQSLTEVLAPVPEPATWGMLIVGFAAVGGVMRRNRTTWVTRAKPAV